MLQALSSACFYAENNNTNVTFRFSVYQPIKTKKYFEYVYLFHWISKIYLNYGGGPTLPSIEPV